VIKTFELSTEMVAFLFQVFEYRGEISHEEILAGHCWRNIAFTSNSPVPFSQLACWPLAGSVGQLGGITEVVK
jgi:hypothetical protein